ncbi:conserved hypothetical protein [Uncinocarpus reesii 1704]|uniref:Patatin-like phospholipase domain-containing protein n=1 Tax=Uncinocarpus reesii (strain UAMH 1704) TaxID=336963 RepID=C4JHN6_UNCRE|nr:uncharacterized protein UREG_02722 [Uncinocarpus reesii 1704]EEP77873.1 conserved hypothetical protein [Uncinocarpus reesii 1704]
MSSITDTTIPILSLLTALKRSGLGSLPKRASIPFLSSLIGKPLDRASLIIYSIRGYLLSEEDEQFLRTEKERRSLSWNLYSASNLHEWLRAAGALDNFEGNNEWKLLDESDEYDYTLVRDKLDDLERALSHKDFGAIIHNIRTSLGRDLANMTNPELYKHTYIGTKNLIDLYVTTATNAVSMVLDIAENLEFGIEESRHLLEQLHATRQGFGRTALLLSGGATFGMNHTGVLKTLWQMRLLPRVISGSSAGSIVAGVICAHLDSEMPKIFLSFGSGDFSVFESGDEVENIGRRLHRFLASGSFFDVGHLKKVMRSLLGNVTFLEAYNRTRRVLNITVSHANPHELPRLLNYITSPNVTIWSAIVTSCSAPMMFATSQLMAKDPTTGEVREWGDSLVQWIDGSVDSDLPMTRLAEMFNVNHFIVSQVNPHVMPFVPPEEALLFAELSKRRQRSEDSSLDFAKELVKEEITSKARMLAEAGILPNALRKFASVMSQEYYGDINIFPEITYEVFPSMLRNPTPDFMLRACLSGERATWPKLGRIRNHCAVEFALDDAVMIMREKIAAAASEADIPMERISSYLEGDMFLREAPLEADPELVQQVEERKAHARAHTHVNAGHRPESGKRAHFRPDSQRASRPHAQHSRYRTKPSRPALKTTQSVPRDRSPSAASASSLNRPSWTNCRSLSSMDSRIPTKSEKHRATTPPNRQVFIQSPMLPTDHQHATQPAHRAVNSKLPLQGTHLPHFIMAIERRTPQSQSCNRDYRKLLRKKPSDPTDWSKNNQAISSDSHYFS